jgi:hypothetical protein
VRADTETRRRGDTINNQIATDEYWQQRLTLL